MKYITGNMDHKTYLKIYRKEKSKEEGVSRNKVFTNRVIEDLVKVKPRDKYQLKHVPGVGKVTIDKYGKDILTILQKEETDDIPDINSLIGDETIHLSKEQENVLLLAYQGENILMTGQGGVGKSFLINLIIKVIEIKANSVQVCALTGSASELLNCPSKTIHAWSGTRIIEGNPESIIKRAVTNKNSIKNWKNVDALVIDEVSMMSKKHFDILNTIGQRIRGNTEAFGGIQLICSGDFYQIPPIADADPNSGCFCFESGDWYSTFPPQNVVELTKVFRQSDASWLKVLKQVRKGGYSLRTIDILKGRIGVPHDSQIIPTRITPSRDKCRRINEREMAKLQTESKVFTMKTFGNTKSYIPPHVLEIEVKNLKKSMLCERLELKIGAKIMCLANLDLESHHQIVNGSQGIIREWSFNGYPIVEFINGRTQEMIPYSIMSETIDGLGIKQVPLLPSWAITTHKSQGITLDEGIIDAGSENFEYGQIYVALSRVRTLEGLYLTGLDYLKIKANPKVTAYYDSLSDRRIQPRGPRGPRGP